MKSFKLWAICATALCAQAAPADFCPNDNICFSWGVPEAAASSGSGNVYFQMKAPTSYEWVGLGIGTGMSGADMFLIYADGKGNVTLSTRHGTGHVMPQHVQQNDVELLEGSGVQNGSLIANVRCGSCDNLDLAGSSNWISAWKGGPALDSTDVNQQITMHDEEKKFQVNLAQASISSDENPFVTPAGNDNTSPSSGSGSGSDSDGDSGSGSGGAVTESDEDSGPNLPLIHGIIMSIVFVAAYPIGAALIPLVRIWWIHSSWQMIAFLAMWAAFGVGYVAATNEGIFWKNTHTRLGTVIVSLISLQPILGWLHHWRFTRTKRRGIWSYAHIIFGRAMMVLGIVNGGLGLVLAGAGQGAIIAYGVVAGVLGAAYVGLAIWGEMRRSRKQREEEKRVSPVMTHETAENWSQR